MKRNLLPSCVKLPVTVFLLLLPFLVSCIRDVHILPDIYTPFPQPIILGSSFYYQRDGKDVTGDEAGMIRKNEDGTYNVKVKRRSPSNVPTAIFITGSFEFSDYYKIICTFPDDPKIKDKPYRIYACGSRNLDLAVDADYATAVDLKGQAVFRNGVAIGTFEMTNEGINTLKPDRRGRPYITVFLYLYFNNVTDPDDYYEFTLDYAGGANGIIPKSVVEKSVVYRAGDIQNKFELPASGSLPEDNYILARYNHRFTSEKLDKTDTDALYLELKVPDEDLGKEIVFAIRNVGLFSDDTNLITRSMHSSARVIAGKDAAEQTEIVKEVTINSNPVSYYYEVKAVTVLYDDLFGGTGTGVRFAISGDDVFCDTDGFNFTLYVPDKYSGD